MQYSFPKSDRFSRSSK